MELFIQFINQLKWHLSNKYLIGVFVPFIILQKEVFLLTMAMALQLVILPYEPKYLGFTNFGDYKIPVRKIQMRYGNAQ